MAVFENSIILLFILSGLLLNDSKASYISSSNPVIEVPGLLIGSQISFKYTGNELSRVTLSIDDSIGKILHFELRINEGCKGNSPGILMNTNTNGEFDENIVTNELPWLKEQNNWYVTAEEDGFLIEGEGKNDDEQYSYKFPYISPHELSDVHRIRLYAARGCGEETNFIGYVELSQKIPRGFTKVLFEGEKSTSKPFAVYIENGEQTANFSAVTFPENILYSYVKYGRNFILDTVTADHSHDNPVEGILEKSSDSTFNATIWTTPDKSKYFQITDMATAEASGYVKFGFEKVTKLEIN